MNPLLNKFIKDDQNGFIKARNTAYGIKLMFDVIVNANSKDISGAMLSVISC